MRMFGGLLMLISMAFPFQAALGQAVQGEVVAGFGGFYRIGKCMPVKIHLENSGPDLVGEISIQISNTSFTQAISLPSPSRKTFAFYVVPPKYFHDLEVRIFADGKLLKVFSSVVQRVAEEETLVVKSSTLRRSLSLSDSPSIGSEGEKVIFVDPQNFPESWNEYDAVNSVILDTSDTTRLNETQRAALSRWTMLGGSVSLSNGGIFARPGKEDKFPSFRTALGLGTFGASTESSKSSEMTYQPSLMDLDEEVFKAMRIKNPISRSGMLRASGIFLLMYGIAIVFCLRFPKQPGTERLWHFSIIPAVALLFSACCPWIGQIATRGNALVRQYSIFHVFANNDDVFTTNDLSLLFPGGAPHRLGSVAQSSFLVQAESENATDALLYEFEGQGMPFASFRTDFGRIKLLSLADFSRQGLFFMMSSAESTTLLNRSKFPLRNCSLIRNGLPVSVGDIAAGKELRLKAESVSDSGLLSGRSRKADMLSKTVDVYQAETLAGTTGDCVICELGGSIPSLKSDKAGLSYTGAATVIYHLGNQQAEKNDLDPK